MTMYIYKIKDDRNFDSWDNVDPFEDCIIIAEINGNSNKECEQKAIDNGYDNDELYGWTFTCDMEIADNIKEF
jgi:hypothetical protein